MFFLLLVFSTVVSLDAGAGNSLAMMFFCVNTAGSPYGWLTGTDPGLQAWRNWVISEVATDTASTRIAVRESRDKPGTYENVHVPYEFHEMYSLNGSLMGKFRLQSESGRLKYLTASQSMYILVSGRGRRTGNSPFQRKNVILSP
jgi:hypothetical protein